MTYTVVVRNIGEPLTNTVRVTDVIPAELTYVPGTFTTTYGAVDATAAPTLKWNGVMSTTPVVTLTYVVTVSTSATMAITNDVAIDPGGDLPLTCAAIVIVNPHQSFLPLVLRNS